jgi:hypothetical protein
MPRIRNVVLVLAVCVGAFVHGCASRPPAATTVARTDGPTAQSLELSFWDSIKNSSNAAEYRAYLAQFPSGMFSDLARARIASLEAAATGAPQAATAPAAQPAPGAATAAAAPSAPQAAGVPANAPRVGDTWTYAYEDRQYRRGDKSRKYTIIVGESTEAAIVDVVQGPSGASLKRTFPRQGSHAVVRDDWIDVVPYLLAYVSPDVNAVSRLRPQVLDNPRNGVTGQPTFAVTSARLNRVREQITVPAGRFEAIRVDYYGTYDDINASHMARTPPSRLNIQVWYSPQVKRMIKMTAQSIRGTYSTSVELESFRVQ